MSLTNYFFCAKSIYLQLCSLLFVILIFVKDLAKSLISEIWISWVHLIQLPEIVSKVIALMSVLLQQLELSLNFLHIEIHVLAFLLLSQCPVLQHLFSLLVVLDAAFARFRLRHRVLLCLDPSIALALIHLFI